MKIKKQLKIAVFPKCSQIHALWLPRTKLRKFRLMIEDLRACLPTVNSQTSPKLTKGAKRLLPKTNMPWRTSICGLSRAKSCRKVKTLNLNLMIKMKETSFMTRMAILGGRVNLLVQTYPKWYYEVLKWGNLRWMNLIKPTIQIRWAGSGLSMKKISKLKQKMHSDKRRYLQSRLKLARGWLCSLWIGTQ